MSERAVFEDYRQSRLLWAKAAELRTSWRSASLRPRFGASRLDEHQRFIGVVRDAVKAAAAGNTAEGMAFLDLGLAWTEAGTEDPWQDDLVHCYRTVIHRYCARFLAPELEGDIRVFRSSELPSR